MIYDKERIKKIIEYKDSIESKEIKDNLQWFIGKYNKVFIKYKELKEKEYRYNLMMRDYYNLEEEKAKIKEKYNIQKNRYNALLINYRNLENKYKESCRKLKSMI